MMTEQDNSKVDCFLQLLESHLFNVNNDAFCQNDATTHLCIDEGSEWDHPDAILVVTRQDEAGDFEIKDYFSADAIENAQSDGQKIVIISTNGDPVDFRLYEAKSVAVPGDLFEPIPAKLKPSSF